MIKKFEGMMPDIHQDSFIADTARLIGDVKIEEGASVWYGAVLRGDFARVTLEKNSNIQDNVTVHADAGQPTIIGDHTVVGHNAVVHGCAIGSNCLIGMGSVVLNGAVIGDNCILGAGSVVTEGKIIPPDSLVLGIPAKVIREITDDEKQAIRNNALNYNKLYKRYKNKT